MRFDFLRRNLGYKLLSLALAILVWSWVYAQSRPNVSREEYVQPEVMNLARDMVIKAPPEGKRVMVTGLASAVEEFRNRPVKGFVDLAGATPGANTLEIRYNTQGLNLDIVGPKTVTVLVDKKAERRLPVEVIPQNPAPAGFEFANKVSDPPQVVVSGLATEVSKVEKVFAMVNNSENNGAFSGSVELVAQAANSAVIGSVTIAPARVNVTLGIKQSPLAKSLILSPSLVGVVAPGYGLYGVIFEPQTVTVTGNQNLIVERSAISVPVDISGLKESVTRRFTVTAPSGLRITEPERGVVRVRVDVRPIASPNATVPAPPAPTPAPGNPPPARNP